MYKVISSWESWKAKDMFEFHEDAVKKAHDRASKDYHESRTFYVVEVMDAIQAERDALPTIGVEVNNATKEALFGESDGDEAVLQIED